MRQVKTRALAGLVRLALVPLVAFVLADVGVMEETKHCLISVSDRGAPGSKWISRRRAGKSRKGWYICQHQQGDGTICDCDRPETKQD